MVECFSVRQTVSRIYLFRFKGRNQNTNKSGDNSREDTPVPISNTEVKLLSADDTWREAAWESRTLPVFCCDNCMANAMIYIYRLKDSP